MCNATSFINHLGVEVAPHTPTFFTSGDRGTVISFAPEMKVEWGFAFRHS
jgi:hypothetical protein